MQLRSNFKAWLATSDAHRRAWLEAERTWSTLGDLPSSSHYLAAIKASRLDGKVDAATRAVPAPPFARGQTARDRRRAASGSTSSFRRSRFSLTSAAAALAAACIAIAYLPTFSTWMAADYATGTGEVRHLTLTDGSEVYLGASSAMKVDFSGANRRVDLLSGQAFFVVAANPQRPFAVIGNGVETTVLGTAFDMRVLSEGARVAVDHGSVAVARVGVPASDGPLGPGDWAQVSAGSGAMERGIGADAGAWREGKLVAIDEEVNSVVDELRRYYSGRIVILSASLGRQRVSGVYRLSNPVAALRAVAEANGATVQQFSPWLVVVYGG